MSGRHSAVSDFHDQAPPLSQIYFYLTQGCNLKCRHCWLAPKYDVRATKFPVLPLDLFKRAIEDALPLGLSTVKLTGGEPLMHPGIRELLSLIRQYDLGLTLETNGYAATPDLVDRIAALPRRAVSVSLDGSDAAVHDRIRGVAGSFTRALEAIRMLVTAGLRPQVIMTLMEGNIHQIHAMVELAESSGAASLKFNILQPTGRGKRLYEDDSALDIHKWLELNNYVETTIVPNSSLDIGFDSPLAFRPLSRIAGGRASQVCGILGIIGVLPSGHYALCGIGEHIPELTFGRIGDRPLKDIWTQHPLLRALRRGLPGELTGICSRCLMKQRCLGSCIAQNYYRKKDLMAPFWFCEAAERAGLFPKSRLIDTPGR